MKHKINGWNRQEDTVLRVSKDGYITLDKVIKEDEEVNIDKKKEELTPEQKHFINQKNEFRKHCDDLGGYIHMIYCKNEILFNNVDMDKANISRIIYLATYIDYNNREEGLLAVRGQYNKLESMTKKDMQEILGLKDTAFKKFFKDMKDNNLIYEANKKFYINTDYFNKGEVNKGDIIKDKGYCRLFIKPIRDLYEGIDSKQHKTLANVYQLIPFIHYANNMLCHNPQDLESEALPMSLKDVGAILNIEHNQSNLNRLVRELGKFYVTIGDVEFKLFSYVKLEDKDFYFVNPYVIYSGNNIEQLRNVADTYFFRGQNK